MDDNTKIIMKMAEDVAVVRTKLEILEKLEPRVSSMEKNLFKI